MKSIVLVISLILIGVILRLWGLGNFDISPDEHHFLHEAYRYITHDPYIVPRHHPFKHAEPFVGHPFLGGYFISYAYKIFGASVASGRLVFALANIIALIGTYILARTLFGNKVAFIALCLLVFLPHDVRYGRDAHLDPLLGATLVWSVFFLWKFFNSKKIHWGGWLGFSSALVWTTKINGPFLLIFQIIALLVFSKIFSLKDWIKIHKYQFILAIISFFLLFYLLVSPSAYFDALINPADPEIVGLKKVLMPFFTNFYPFTVKRIIPFLYSIPFTVLVIYGIYISLKEKKPQHLFILSVLIIYSHIFITHVGHSGEYGYITLNPYFAIFASLGYLNLKPFLKPIAFILIVIFFIPLLILHGLRMDLGQFTQLTQFNDSNFRYGQRPYRDAVSAINNLPGNPTVLWIKNGDRQVPFMDIRGGVKLWPYFEDNIFDTILVSDLQKKSDFIVNKNYIEYAEFSYKGYDKVWILRKKQ